MNGWKSMSVAAIAALVIGSAANADTELQIDLNSLLTTGGGSSFGTGFSGTMTIADDSDSALNAGFIDGALGTGFFSLALKDMSGSITLLAGTVTGGSLTVIAWDTTPGSGTFSTYAASIVPGSGVITSQAGQGFSIDGLTFSGTFSSTTFAGVDVTAFDDVEPLWGSFLEFGYDPDTSGVDANSDLDLYVIIPLPSTAGLGLLGLATIGARRRRR